MSFCCEAIFVQSILILKMKNCVDCSDVDVDVDVDVEGVDLLGHC